MRACKVEMVEVGGKEKDVGLWRASHRGSSSHVRRSGRGSGSLPPRLTYARCERGTRGKRNA